jgi:hypothetical protein
MPRLRAARAVSLGGSAAVGGRVVVRSARRVRYGELDLERLSGADGWAYAAMLGRREVGRLAEVRLAEGRWFWSLRLVGVAAEAIPCGYAATRLDALREVAAAWGLTSRLNKPPMAGL